VKEVFLLLIHFYQKAISPWLGSNCRFYPTCSEWGREAIEEYGALQGGMLTLKRLFSCHPLHPGGYAPLRKNG